MSTQPGVYLLHFENKLAHAGHYLGMAADVPSRIKKHLNGTSKARLIDVIREKGISYTHCRTWVTETTKQAYELEKKLKRRKNAPRYCFICSPPKNVDKENHIS